MRSGKNEQDEIETAIIGKKHKDAMPSWEQSATNKTERVFPTVKPSSKNTD
jgi:hypothetical protein